MDDKRALLKVISNGTVNPSRLHLLPLPIRPFSPRIYSCVVMSTEFYQDLPTPWVLLFQMDTLILRRDDQQHDRSPNRFIFLRDFFSYPYLGAPWKFRHCSETAENPCRDGGNGGLTLRSRDFMINVTNHTSFVVKRHRLGSCENEDMVLSDFMRKVRSEWLKRERVRVIERERGERDSPISIYFLSYFSHAIFTISFSLSLSQFFLPSLAPQSVRVHFAMETMFLPHPLGVHKPWLYLAHTTLRPLYKRWGESFVSFLNVIEICFIYILWVLNV